MGKSIAVLGAGVACALLWTGPAFAATSSLLIEASSPQCVGGYTTITLDVQGAVPGQTYALFGTSGYQASDPITATAADFSTTVQINHGYLGLTGDLESVDRSTTSNQIDVPNACPRVTTVVDPVTPSPTLITHIDTLGIASPITSTPRPIATSSRPPSAHHTSAAHVTRSATSTVPATASVTPTIGAAARTAHVTKTSWPDIAGIVGGALILGSLTAGFVVRRRSGR